MAAPAPRPASPLQLLAALVRQRRTQLDLGKDEAARECGVAPMTYRSVEEGRSVRDTTYAKIEKRYEFVAGACRAVLDGADSIKLLDGTELFNGAQIRYPNLDDLPDTIRRAIDSAASSTAPELTHGQTKAMADRVVEELRERGILPSGD